MTTLLGRSCYISQSFVTTESFTQKIIYLPTFEAMEGVEKLKSKMDCLDFRRSNLCISGSGAEGVVELQTKVLDVFTMVESAR